VLIVFVLANDRGFARNGAGAAQIRYTVTTAVVFLFLSLLFQKGEEWERNATSSFFHYFYFTCSASEPA